MEILIRQNNIEFQGHNLSFPMNMGVSVAANMREALKNALPQPIGDKECSVLIDTPVALVPEEQMQYEEAEALYRLTVSTSEGEDITVIGQPVEKYGVVALFAVSKDLNTVIQDNFKKYEFRAVALQPLTSGERRKGELYAYFNDRSMHVSMIDRQGRIAFFNSFISNNSADRAYLLLGVWKQLNLNQLKDTLRLEGDIPEKQALTDILKEFIKKVEICE